MGLRSFVGFKPAYFPPSKEGVLSALDHAHDQWYSSPIRDEEESIDLFTDTKL